jgi:hypothetical protein
MAYCSYFGPSCRVWSGRGRTWLAMELASVLSSEICCRVARSSSVAVYVDRNGDMRFGVVMLFEPLFIDFVQKKMFSGAE